MINTKIPAALLLIALFFAITCALYPQLDLEITQLFYHDSSGFFYKTSIIPVLIFQLIPILTWIFTFICAALLVKSIIVKDKNHVPCLKYLLFSLALGPGLIVNLGFKNNIGRARPNQIVEFGGTKKFSPVFAQSDQCITNCSFPSGHAAMGFYFTAIAYYLAMRSPKTWRMRFNQIYMLGFVFGLITGVSRMVMGAHFASDVTVSFIIITIVNHLFYLYFTRIID